MGDFHPKVTESRALCLLGRKRVRADGGLEKPADTEGGLVTLTSLDQMKLPFLCVKKC